MIGALTKLYFLSAIKRKNLQMKTIPQTCDFYLHKVPNHLALKEQILVSISNMGRHSLEDKNQKIFNSDWYLPSSFPRPYFEHIRPTIETHLQEIKQSVNGSTTNALTLQNYWFQQYTVDDYHDWHIHEMSMFSNVYYVDLPQGASKTTFKYREKTFDVNVEEGHILTFPSCFAHCSKPNQAGVKTVISFNY